MDSAERCGAPPMDGAAASAPADPSPPASPGPSPLAPPSLAWSWDARPPERFGDSAKRSYTFSRYSCMNETCASTVSPAVRPADPKMWASARGTMPSSAPSSHGGGAARALAAAWALAAALSDSMDSSPMVWVFPEPVCPYTRMPPSTPLSTPSTTRAANRSYLRGEVS